MFLSLNDSNTQSIRTPLMILSDKLLTTYTLLQHIHRKKTPQWENPNKQYYSNSERRRNQVKKTRISAHVTHVAPFIRIRILECVFEYHCHDNGDGYQTNTGSMFYA